MGELIRFWKLPREHEKLLLPSDEEFERFLFERYQKMDDFKGLKFFYTIKPLIPRFLQISLRRLKAKSIKNKFPNWPIEPYLEDFKKTSLKYIKDIEKIPFIWFWPKDKSFALCLTHDVETAEGLKRINKICEVEKKFGLRSAWFFVPERYSVPDTLIDELKEQDFEIGIHGLKHDGKLFSSKKIFDDRIQKIHCYASRWGATGFRSPSLLRNFEWMKVLPFEYDSSFPDTDPYGPQAGGCLSIFPFFIGNILEIPVTMPQDHTLFVILRKKNIDIWKEKINWIEKMNGLALIIVHPDYFSNEVERYYYEFLDFVLSKENLWFSKPIEICKWWKDRNNSNLITDKHNKIVIAGPAEKQGTISYIEKVSA